MDAKQLIEMMKANPEPYKKALANPNNPIAKMIISKAVEEMKGVPNSPELLHNMAIEMGIPKTMMTAEFTNQLFNFILLNYQK